MAKVQWTTGIDHVSGALSKPGKNPQHSCTQMLLGTHRTAETTNPAQKNTAGGKQSMKAYIWSLEMAAFDNQ